MHASKIWTARIGTANINNNIAYFAMRQTGQRYVRTKPNSDYSHVFDLRHNQASTN